MRSAMEGEGAAVLAHARIATVGPAGAAPSAEAAQLYRALGLTQQPRPLCVLHRVQGRTLHGWQTACVNLNASVAHRGCHRCPD
jgi:hypothetical protein